MTADLIYILTQLCISSTVFTWRQCTTAPKCAM